MGLFNNWKRSGSTNQAWWIVVVATILLVSGLLLFGPQSAVGPEGIEYNPYPEMFRRLMSGLLVTAQVVFLSLIFSTLGGIAIGVGRVSRLYPARMAASMYVEIIRGIPLLVILFMIYYGMNQFLPPGHKLDAFVAAVIGLSLCYGAYMGEIVRAGIEAIPHEEIEAASLEGGRGQVLWYITLPRALRTILPAGANEFIALLKDSSLISILAISELTRTGQEYAASKFLFFETYAMVALIYMLMTLVLSRGVHLLESSWSSTK
jgi:polar amino acid transport system permease protein